MGFGFNSGTFREICKGEYHQDIKERLMECGTDIAKSQKVRSAMSRIPNTDVWEMFQDVSSDSIEADTNRDARPCI